ncbi:phenylalanine--tRNA ligase subunit alpha [Desulfotalea psychrophila]|uniref:Phenylalanine--tRNA ligase alpha subunit n=1 Tax=Desulfotalea psychrophila (strain LSv54 / DSM 12343) TaxID=177439 RepID=SYFA_DESPS|nr:phenylalanine--tRNA ligase subunit alpha [Desulfotalea psychrophila]Q6ANC1.1 RecName: Full=Phenylalanine--tRNA ligase alpha subunit; AltName: Full=Phenylalanyl-tRNA synthetase alpha subunit; Short=PheRS [Desulfotalea psychrophila LSv54]CAG36153.1 probable phenylalanyl-tRNA synthetase, alpha chain [Desulfotalea psychrophila LSv54]
MEQELQNLENEAKASLTAICASESLEEFRIKYLGRKGLFTTVMRQLGSAPAEDRPRLGQLANTIKAQLEEQFEEKRSSLSQQTSSSDTYQSLPDLTLPGRQPAAGNLHPVTQVMQEVCAIFEAMGFSVAEGPDVEQDYYNFEALNIPAHHPARDMHDTFYVSGSTLLRTHTSPMQARVMEKQDPPLRMIAPGKVYRCDSDITHTPMFHQVEGLLVDKNISFADLKGVLTLFLQKIFKQDLPVRFRPSFFPFTEPSAEVDIACVMCGGKGCRVCKKTGWLEILGAGMVDPEVFKMVGYDPEVYSGFAFGLGIERIAMLKYRIDDIRLFYENDQRFLSQF